MDAADGAQGLTLEMCARASVGSVREAGVLVVTDVCILRRRSCMHRPSRLERIYSAVRCGSVVAASVVDLVGEAAAAAPGC